MSREIYRPYVETTTISFEEVAPAADEMAERMRAVLAWTPWLVALDDEGGVTGYAYGSRHRERAGYRWAVDLAVYVDRSHQGRGVGKALYGELVPMLRRQRFVNAYAGIGLPNDASVALHESVGMTRVAVYEQVGWKLWALGRRGLVRHALEPCAGRWLAAAGADPVRATRGRRASSLSRMRP